MDGSVAEGISSSLQEHSSFSPDPLGHPVLGHASELEPVFSGHVGDDLGLTLSPGSQQEFHHGGLLKERPFDDGVRQYHNDSTYWTEEEHETREASINGELSATSTSRLDGGYESRKRSRDSAFADEDTDLFAPSEKKRLTGVKSPLDAPSAEYLSPYPLDSLQQADHGEAAPNSPDGVVAERAESPNSLFDEPTSPTISPDVPADEKRTGSPSTDEKATEEHTEPRSASDITKERFGLSQEDLEAAKTREIFQGFGQQPQYLSPYPVYGGALGYLPSTPNVHLKCVEVTGDGRINEQIAFFQRRIQALTHERNKYQRAWEQWTTVDPSTGKTKEQLLTESNAQLKRLLTLQEKKANGYKKEAEAWKRQAEAWQERCRNVSIMYNNLLYDIQLRIQAGAGHNLPMVAPHPMGVQAQPMPAASWMPAPQPTGIQSGSTPAARPEPPSQPQSQPAVTPAPSPVTIDLTSDEGGEAGLARPSSPVDNNAGAELRQSFRRKSYDWLGDRNHMRSGYKPRPDYPPYWHEVQSRRCSSSSSSSRRASSSSARPSTADSPPSVLPETDTSNSTPLPAVAEQTDNEGGAGYDDNELARMLEEELAGDP